jgi:VIT1/CCC1 family predicted Fe2+/Mn2+ transporter
LVFDREEVGEGYAIKKQIFERMYQLVNKKYTLSDDQKKYLNNRIFQKISEFKKKSKKDQYTYYLLQMLAILMAALVPLFSSFVSDDTMHFKWVIAILGGASAIIAAILSLFRFQGKWIKNKMLI